MPDIRKCFPLPRENLAQILAALLCLALAPGASACLARTAAAGVGRAGSAFVPPPAAATRAGAAAGLGARSVAIGALALALQRASDLTRLTAGSRTGP